MKIALLIHTPGQAHLWRYPVLALKQDGHRVIVLARDDGYTCALLEGFGLKTNIYGRAEKIWQKIIKLPVHFIKSFTIIKKFKPDIILGAGFIEAYCGFLLRKPCLIFEDSEGTPTLERIQWKYLVDAILTPECFKLDFGKKHVRFGGYKELAYLHPSYFTPDPSIYEELKINRDQKYIILRFNGFDAFHDIGRQGFSLTDKYELVRKLEKYARIFISEEGSLPSDLKSYKLPTSPERIHHVLYYAQMIVADTGTMVTEAALLGTPAIQCNSNVGQYGNFIELEHDYGLVYMFRDSGKAISRAVELIQQPDLKEQWAEKRKKLLNDKIDVTSFLVDFIEKYAESSKKMKSMKKANTVLEEDALNQ